MVRLLAAALLAFAPAAWADPVRVSAAGSAADPAALSIPDLQALPAGSVTLPAEHGAAMQMRGPALWDVLQRAGAIDPDFHHRVGQVVTITGKDGYGATLALGEIDPEFEGKAVILATERDGAALEQPRLAIPGDKRLGRDVRDVASIAVRQASPAGVP